jgi:hypothetical protein
MGGWLPRMAARAVLAGLGLLLWAGWVMVSDGAGRTHVEELSELPPVVFGGGGGRFELDVEVAQPSRLTSSFERWHEDGPSELLASNQMLSPGEHHFSVDVPESTYGYFEVGVPEARVGARISWTLRMDGAVLEQQQVELEEPLEAQHAFFVQFEFDAVEALRHYARQ